MKLQCNLEKLKNAISTADRITGKNLTLPVLGSVLLVATDKVLKIRSTNLSLGVEIEIPVKIEKEGIVAISGGSLANTFSNIFHSDTVNLEAVDGNLLVKTKKSKIRLKGEPYDDFPSLPRVEGDSFEIPSKKFVDGIKSVYYASAVTDIKPEISSVYIYGEDNNIFFVSTDSFRLAEKKVKLKKDVSVNGILVPFKNIPEIVRVFSDIKDDVVVNFNKNQISFSSENVYLTSRVIDGVFPDYRQIIPKEFKTEATVLKHDISNALKLSNIFSDKFNQLDLNINTKDKLFELSSENANVGENNTFLDAALEGQDVSLRFNYKYFLDCLPSVSTDSLTIKMNGINSPMVISPVGDKTFTYLIMPMNR